MTDWLRPHWRPAMAVLLPMTVFVLLRYWLARTPILSETYYDEALTGLMSLAILRGMPQVFYWGEPYGGADGDAYLAAASFWLLGPSTLVLRMSAVVVAALWASAAGSIARRIAGDGAGVLAAFLVAVPPVFLSYVQLSSQGEGVAMTLGVLVLAAAARLVGRPARPRDEIAAWTLLGLAGGLGWWASPMIAMCLVAAALGLLVARPGVLRQSGPLVAGATFLLASLPFWAWNWEHGWVTFRHFVTWGPPLPELATRVRVVSGALLSTLHGGYWDAHAVRLSPALAGWAWALTVTVYVPAMALAAVRIVQWGWRLGHGQRPWRDALDVVVLAFWLTVAGHLWTSFGAQGVLRYAITFYAVLPVLWAVWLACVARWGRAGRVAALALAVALFGFHLTTHAVLVRDAAAYPRRPVDAAVARLERLGVQACYADSRIAQVITFESRERIRCVDYYGFRDFALLEAVDRLDNPQRVAIVTHRTLQNPTPQVMANTLRLMGADFQTDEIGDYVIFHHVRPPDLALKPIPPVGWAARASLDGERAGAAFDRQVWTRWRATKLGGEWYELDLGRSRPLAQVTIESGPFPLDGPVGLRVETSPDGQVWDIAAAATEVLPGLHWWKGHPRGDESGRVIVRLPGRPVRYVRLVQTGQEPSDALWSISEIFVYEAVPGWTPGVAAEQTVNAAMAALAHWKDDPWGPHPRRTPSSYEHRRSQVPWAAVFAAASRAIEVAPEWEEAHHLYARALALWGWSETLDVAVARARMDAAWGEVVRWARAADADSSALWRSGRLEAQLEALRRLGRTAEADGLAAEAARIEASHQPPSRLHARFDNGLELTGVTLPPVARPGDVLTVRYAWLVNRRPGVDLTAFVHLDGPGRRLVLDHALGGDFGSSQWVEGERVVETVPFHVPATAPAGPYRVLIGVWHPETGRRARVETSYLPHDRSAVAIGTLEIKQR
jgi:dolichyl-phosphate-mannose-protein mannosyltransferase